MIEVHIELSAPLASADLIDITQWLAQALQESATDRPDGLAVHSIELRQSDA